MKINLRKGAKNIYGPALKRAREQSRLKMTQVDLAEILTGMGLSIDRSIVSKIENQKRALGDIELHYFVSALRINFVRLAELLRQQPNVVPDFADYRASDLDEDLQVAEDEDEKGW
jgi:transcriptional regulator with XRE-family HTH domain